MNRRDILYHKTRYVNVFQIGPGWNKKSGQGFNLGKNITNQCRDYKSHEGLQFGAQQGLRTFKCSEVFRH